MSTSMRPSAHSRPLWRSRVLIVDSDRQIRALLKEWLERAGLRSVEASPMSISTELAAQCDIVMVDVCWPLQSARHTIESVVVAAPQASIVAMSADGLASGQWVLEAVAHELGVAAVLVKPFDRDALMLALERARTTI